MIRCVAPVLFAFALVVAPASGQDGLAQRLDGQVRPAAPVGRDDAPAPDDAARSLRAVLAHVERRCRVLDGVVAGLVRDDGRDRSEEPLRQLVTDLEGLRQLVLRSRERLADGPRDRADPTPAARTTELLEALDRVEERAMPLVAYSGAMRPINAAIVAADERLALEQVRAAEDARSDQVEVTGLETGLAALMRAVERLHAARKAFDVGAAEHRIEGVSIAQLDLDRLRLHREPDVRRQRRLAAARGPIALLVRTLEDRAARLQADSGEAAREAVTRAASLADLDDPRGLRAAVEQAHERLLVAEQAPRR